MNINDRLYGFTVTNREEISDAKGTLYTMKHDKTGAALAFLERDDRNMTFSIAFRTPPKDDTGVFHIIEHSVLCGSKKYPVKEPFVELLKGSLNTFLNALTYEDRTVYPVSSRCERDFLNLTDVYLDAVFHPRMLSDENIFLQEGWHYEYDETSGKLSYNGVVYNEMCGAYSSPEEVAENELRRALFPSTLYRHDSGGSPSAIPSLTYEQLKEAHATYYHPSNSMIFLDGKIDIDKLLPLIASYLDEYDRLDINVVYPVQEATSPETIEVEFEPSGDPLARVLFGYVYSSPEEKQTDYALAILDNTLTATNESRLKKGLIESGLCEDVVTSVYRSRQTQYTIEVIGVKEEDVPKVAPTLERLIREIAREGVDKERLLAAICCDEFKLKEGDQGSFPRGVSNALTAYSFWTFGYSPAAALAFSDDIEFARASAEGDYYEKLLLAATVDNPHKATVVMLPRQDFGERQEAERSAELSRIKATLSDAELEAVRERSLRLKELQSAPDSPEAVATLPKLSLSDIEPKLSENKTESVTFDGITVLSHNIDCTEITYLSLCFSANDLSDGELLSLSLLTSLFKNLPTENYSASALQNEIRSKLGSLSFGLTTFPTADGSGNARISLSVSASALARNRLEIARLINEILLTTDFSDTSVIEKTLIQLRSAMEESLTSDSLSYALTRVTSSLTKSGRVAELTSGYTAYTELCALTQNVSESAKRLSVELPVLLSRLAVKERLTVSLASQYDGELCQKLTERLPSGAPVTKVDDYKSVGIRHGIAIPARVSYAACGALAPEACDRLGLLRVVRSILSYEYLWNEIRVKGGAYGTGFIVRKSGELGFYSYRDPSPEVSLKVYTGAPSFLRKLASEGDDLTKFIIGAYGEYDMLTTPRTEAAQALYDYMTGWTREQEKALTGGILSVTANDLYEAADLIEKAFLAPSVCVIGDKAAITKITPPLDVSPQS